MNGLVLFTAPTYEPITLPEAKEWLRVEGSEEDALIQGLIEAARAHVENFTRRALITQTWEVSFDCFPSCRQIVLPRPPLQSVSSVKYYDADGALQTCDPIGYHVDARAQPGRVVLHQDYDWPEIDERPNAVIVQYVAGYGSPSMVPQGLRTAMRYMVSNWFENRVHINIGNIVNPIDDTVEVLLWQHRIPGIY